MERLSIGDGASYSPIEAAIHVGRYAPVLPFCRGKRVLDIACGEGYGSWLLSQADALSVHGVDRSADAISEARHHFQAHNLSFDVCNAGDLEDRLEGMRFDIITCIETIEHIDEPRAFLRQLRRLAAPDCLILITCPNDHWYYGADQSNPYHVRKYTFDEFRALTTAELGEQVQWFAGTAAQGFVTVPLCEDGAPRIQQAPSRYVNVDQLGSAVLCQPGVNTPIDVGACSYFAGVWNRPEQSIGGGAVFPMSMDVYALREQAPALQASLVANQSENSRLQERLNAITRDHHSLETDVRALRVQAASLRRENDVLAESVARWRAESAAAREAQQRLEAECGMLRAAIERWSARKRRLVQLVPTALRPSARHIYRRLVRRV